MQVPRYIIDILGHDIINAIFTLKSTAHHNIINLQHLLHGLALLYDEFW